MEQQFIELLKDNFDTIDEIESYFDLLLNEIRKTHIMDEEYIPTPEFSDNESEVSSEDLTDEDIEIQSDKDNFLSIK